MVLGSLFVTKHKARERSTFVLFHGFGEILLLQLFFDGTNKLQMPQPLRVYHYIRLLESYLHRVIDSP
jgi:hypothetical protein